MPNLGKIKKEAILNIYGFYLCTFKNKLINIKT
jgi:hypothetical protein